ncbi:MAG: family acetyltransferase [Crocinitomicaceae bacterium]|jgi:ribosomal protein S18 acetylase RimI-like enzyme|nr:family acetyltransferase [Crocinitomicaceae bacterium]
MIRPYQISDRESVLKLFHLNCPAAFAESEFDDLTFYLNHHLEDYFVLESGNEILACGGINSTENPTQFKISWDIVHPEHHGKGLGKQLLEYRVDFAREKLTAHHLTVRTSQLAYRFYEKSGFQLEETQPDYWAKGFDLYRMELKL